MSYEFIIAEKPAAAQKIALALADDKPKKKALDGVPYYELYHKGNHIVIGAAVGHLFTLAEKEKNWSYPTFSIQWTEAAKVNKASKFTAKYVKALKALSKHATSFTVATDYDVEGEVIGLNVIKYICKQDDAQRMKFSTLTKPDLIASYQQKMPHIDWGQALAGLTRHELDWYYGINLSRALTNAIRKAGRFTIMSIGRVQGPALKIVVEREKEIQAFEPKDYWEIELKGTVREKALTAWHAEGKFWEKEKADAVIKKTKGKDALITSIKKRQFLQQPPNPFDLTSLQVEAYRVFKITPKKTLEIAQELYTAGYISYPRTSSQQLPPTLGYKKLLTALQKNTVYQSLANELLKKSTLKPNNGKKTDPAHPAIYPTGIIPEKLDKEQEKIYDLIVKRFLATFADPAKRETVEYTLTVNNEPFIAKGTRTIEEGWHKFYRPYVKLEEEELPYAEENDPVQVKSIKAHKKQTKPPARYTQASLIKELEKRNLGTKATRAQIIDTLYQRGYIEGKQIKATVFGIKTIETLAKYSPQIIDEQLTRHFEEEMEHIREKKKEKDQVLEEAKQVLLKILEDFKQKEQDIGKELLASQQEATTEANTLGECPKCHQGKLILRKGKYGWYVQCDNDDCKLTLKTPQEKTVKPAKKLCPECNYPMIAYLKNRRKQELCINPECPSKQHQEKPENEGKLCPKCKKGHLVLRKGIYGSFLACDQYPKCKYTEKIGQPEVDEFM